MGQAETQDRQRVQPPTSTSRPPKGAPAGSATRSTGAGAARCSSIIVLSRTLRFLPAGRKLAGRGDGMPGGTRSSAGLSASGSSVSISPQASGP